jgi:hypothetical protein
VDGLEEVIEEYFSDTKLEKNRAMHYKIAHCLA